MPNRAFIVAIEQYSEVEEGLFSKSLSGTHESALSFRDWLIRENGLDPDDIFFCAEDSTFKRLEGPTFGATRAEIRQALQQLIGVGQDATAELFFFFSGHAFRYTDTESDHPTEVLIAADFKNQLDGDPCLKLDEIRSYLRKYLGWGDHFYFIDGCRNNIPSGDIAVTNLGLQGERSYQEEPRVYNLYSTVPGATASVESGFTTHLLNGLNGKGRAKVWLQGIQEMGILFDSLLRYVKSQMSADGHHEGDGDVIIRRISPTPEYSCNVIVENAQLDDEFHVEIETQQRHPIRSFSFSGPSGHFSSVPNEYWVRITHPHSEIVPRDPCYAELYDNCEIRVEKGAVPAAPPPPSPSPPPSGITIVGSPHTTSEIWNLELGEEERGDEEFTIGLPAGPYLVKTFDAAGMPIRRQEVSLSVGEHLTVDMARYDWSPLRQELLASIPGPHYAGTIDFSEGPVADQDLGLWLALIGASRIFGSEGAFPSLEPLPFRTFFEEERGAAPVYVLAGFDDPDVSFEVGISEDDSPEWLQPNISDIPGLYEVPFHMESGQYLLSIRLNQNSPLTLIVRCLENYATLVTVARSENGELAIQQFILPIEHLHESLPPDVEQRLNLRSIKRIAQAKRLFANRRSLYTVFSECELANLLHGKSPDPLMSVIAGYELVRRGQTDRLRKEIEYLHKLPSDIPDVDAIVMLSGDEQEQLSRPPLFLDGLLAIPSYQELLPLDSNRLDFRGPWTAWRSAVKIPE